MNSSLLLLIVAAGALLTLALCYRLVLRLLGVVLIPNNGVGIVTKKVNIGGRNAVLPDGKIIAQHGEAGVQADTLGPGFHSWLWPWRFRAFKSEPRAIKPANG